MKKLFIIEYNEDYTGGSAIVIANNKEELLSLMNNVVIDDYKCQLYKLQIRYNGKAITKKAIELLLEDLPLIRKDILNSCIKKNGYDNGLFRLDWILSNFEFNGLILTHEFPIKTEKHGLISNTYCYA